MLVYEDREVTRESGEELEEEEEGIELAASSVVGFNLPKTMKVKGNLEENEVVCLIDSGASHNFVSLDLVEKLGLKMDETKKYGVTLGNGRRVKGTGVCRGIRLELQGLLIEEEYLPMKLGGCDVILGIKWLQTLGPVVHNWSNLIMKFRRGRDWICLKGDPSLTKALVGLRALIRNTNDEDEVYWVLLQTAEATEEAVNGPIPEALSKLLIEYQDVFEMPKSLPPFRERDHTIILKEGEGPISVRPYRYPQCQREEIEKMVEVMLEAGLI